MAKTSDTKAKSRSATTKARTSSKAAGTTAAQAGPPRQPGVERRRNHPVRAKHGYIQLILTQPLPQLGQAGDLGMVEKHRQRLKELEEARRADLQNLAAQIAQRSLTIEANANAEGHLYGSVNADQIAAALRTEGFPIEAENVRIEGPLKELGLYSIRVHLAQDIDSEVKLWVVPTHTEEPVG